MTGLAQSARAAEPSEPGGVNEFAEPTQAGQVVRRPPRQFAAIADWRGIGELICGVVVGLAVGWFIFFGPGELGSRAEWLFGAAAFAAVVLALWQTLSIQRQAKQSSAEAAERLRNELAAAEQRSARELALRQALHQTELEAQQTLHRAELEAQRERARMEHDHLRRQLQKQAVIELSRAVHAHTHMLATLWNQGASILRIEDRDEREQAMNPIFEQISQVVNDFSVEFANTQLLAEDDRLHHALNRVNEAALMAIRVAEDVHVAVVDGRALRPNPISPVQQLMHTRAAEARRLAWDLLRTGLDDSEGGTE
jgi:hypothetical protein